MRIVAISDTHNQHKKITVPDGDVLVHAGDFSGMGTIRELENFLEWFDKQPHEHKVFIAGNHDFCFQEKPEESKELVNQTSCTYLQDSPTKIEGFLFYGSPWTPTFGNWAFMKDEIDLDDYWEKIPETTDVLITHGPPKHTLDKTNGGVNAGSEFLKNRFLTIKPKVHLFGHIHEDSGKVKNENTIFVNASSCNSLYHPINKPAIIDL